MDVRAARLPAEPATTEGREREQLLDRLQSLRRALPVLAQEMAAARRQAARLRTDNRKLSEQVRKLRATIDAREHKAT
jgi:phage shock protein A